MTNAGPYEEMSELYERHAADGTYNALYDRPAMFDAIGAVDGMDVLDAACGPGFYLAELVRGGFLILDLVRA